MCAKFKVDRLSRFRTGARQVFTTQKLFPSEIPLTMKIATTNSVLGKLPPSPNSNANPKPNSDPDWGQFSSEAIFRKPTNSL